MKIHNAVVTPTKVVFWNSIFSNFLPCTFTFKGMTVKSSEQAFMICKGRHFGDVTSCMKILEAKTPKEAKELGRLVKNFNEVEWNKVRLGYMIEVLVEKFGQNPNLKTTLLNTEERQIIEGSPYDKIWGVGIHWQDADCLDESKWKGQNLLGIALMNVREQLKAK